MTPGRVVEIVRAAAGAAGLVIPASAARVEAASAAPFPDPLLRVLGARQLLQAVLLWKGGGPEHRFGALIDGLHALTMAATAGLSARYRRSAVTQMMIATGFLTAETVSARLSR